MTYSDYVQAIGAVAIFLGYYWMAKDIKKSSLALTIGCAIWAYWATLIRPFPYWLFSMEFILGGLSLRSLIINARKEIV